MKRRISEIPYLSILKNAFTLTWKNRYLWWFGFFAMIGSAGSFDWMHNQPEKNDWTDKIANHPHLTTFLIVGLVALFVILIFIIILSIISRGALISSIEKHHANQSSNFKLGLVAGKKHFWRIFLINLFSGLFVLIASAILFPPVVFLFWNHNYFLGAVMATLAVIIFIPLVIIVAYLRIFGYLYAILGKLKPWVAIESAYSLFKKNVKPSLIMAAIFILINIISFFLIATTIFPLALVFVPTGLVMFLIAGRFGAIAIGLIALFIFGVFLFFLRSLLEVFFQTAWILFFHEIAAPEEKEILTEPIVESEPLPKPLPTVNLEGE